MQLKLLHHGVLSVFFFQKNFRKFVGNVLKVPWPFWSCWFRLYFWPRVWVFPCCIQRDSALLFLRPPSPCGPVVPSCMFGGSTDPSPPLGKCAQHFLNTSGVLSKKMLSVILTFGSVLTRKMHLEVQWGFPCQSWESLALESRRLRGWLHYKWAIWVVEKVAFLSPSFFMSKARLIVLTHKIWRVD